MAACASGFVDGQSRLICTRFCPKPAGNAPQAIGLPFSMSLFLPSAVAFVASVVRPDKDLQDDKEGYATGVVWKCDMNVV